RGSAAPPRPAAGSARTGAPCGAAAPLPPPSPLARAERLLGARALLGQVDLEPPVAADVSARGPLARRRQPRQDALDVDGAPLLGERVVRFGPVARQRRRRDLRHAD